MGVNKKLAPMKAHYFLFNAGTAPVVPFMPTYARQLGFSKVIVGIIYTVLPIVGMLAKPLFGAIADRFQRQKLLFLVFQILTASAFFCIIFIPSIPQHSKMELHCNNGVTDMRYCPSAGNELNECVLHQIQNDNTSAYLRCETSCTVEQWMVPIICSWNVTSACKTAVKDSEIHFTAAIKAGHEEELKGCLYFMLHHAVFDGEHNSSMYCPHKQGDNYFKMPCNVKCNNADVNAIITESKIPNSEVTRMYQFWMFFLLLIISWAGMAVVVTVGDAICFEMLGDKPHLYGRQRLWGAVGWGSLSIITGTLIDAFSDGSSNKNYSVVFYLMLIMIVGDMFVSSKLQYKQTKMSTNLLKDVGTVFTSARVFVFFVWCIVVGLCTALFWNFLMIYVEEMASCENRGWIKTLQGLAMAVQCFGGEIPFFFLSGWILKKLGHVNAMSLVLFGLGVRLLLYSALTNPWYILPIELMNGATYGIFFSTMASYASILAPPGTEATLQGLVGAVFEGIGVALGSLLAGFSYDTIGGSRTFAMFGSGALICCAIHIIIQMILKRSQDYAAIQQSPQPADTMHILNEQDTHVSIVPSRTSNQQ